jgi:hypothetical protein
MIEASAVLPIIALRGKRLRSGCNDESKNDCAQEPSRDRVPDLSSHMSSNHVDLLVWVSSDFLVRC